MYFYHLNEVFWASSNFVKRDVSRAIFNCIMWPGHLHSENPPSTSPGQQENGVYWPIGMHLCRPQSDDAPFAGSGDSIANAGGDKHWLIKVDQLLMYKYVYGFIL